MPKLSRMSLITRVVAWRSYEVAATGQIPIRSHQTRDRTEHNNLSGSDAGGAAMLRFVCSSYMTASIPPSTSTPTPRYTPIAALITPLPGAPTSSPIPTIIAPAPTSTPAPVSAVVASTSTPAPAVIAPTSVTPRTPITSHTALPFPFPRSLVFLVQHVHLITQRALSRLQHIQIFQIRSAWQFPQTRSADTLFRKQIVDELVHIRQAEVLLQPAFDLAVVGKKRFQGSVYLDRFPSKANVERC